MVLAGNDLTIDESVGILRVRSIRAELGLSARNPSMKGRCSNAGGLSAELQINYIGNRDIAYLMRDSPDRRV